MKYIKVLIIVVGLALVSCNKQSVSSKDLTTEIDSVSYALGMNLAAQTKANFEEINEELYIQGFKNGLDSTNLLIDNKEAGNIVNAYFSKKRMAQQKKMQEEALKKIEVDFADVKKAGEEFMAANKTKEGVQTTASGLQYIVIKKGNGDLPKATDKIKVHYHGTLIDGTVFDSSVEKGKPYETPMNQLITGWKEGLKLMPVGSKFKFFVPQELAYGAFPHRGGKVRPFDPLIFELELLEIMK